MATFEKQETRKKKESIFNCGFVAVFFFLFLFLNSTSVLKIPGLSLTYLEPLPCSRHGAEQPESSTP